MIGTIIGQNSAGGTGGGGGNTYKMTIDQSGENRFGGSSTHQKTKSQPNANIFQWTTAQGTAAEQMHFTGGGHTRDKSNEHL